MQPQSFFLPENIDWRIDSKNVLFYEYCVVCSLELIMNKNKFIVLIQFVDCFIFFHFKGLREALSKFYHMAHYQEKQENYAKWQGSIWNSVQKQITLFQKKVTDCMIMLGDLSKKNKNDFQIQPIMEDDVILGEQFYTEMIRTYCVDKNYLPKKPPTQQQVEDIVFEEQIKRAQLIQTSVVQQKKEKKGGKKGGKNVNNNTEEKMKMKIVQDNFKKDIQLVIKSHSLERMQVEFGLKQKKLQLKLITFFYVAYFIRKNKVNLKIDQTQIFQLINILIKIVRIFSHMQGQSFVDNTKKIEISPTLIRDLKYCIKGLKEYYQYTNKTVIIKYPKLVYYTNYDKFFPTLDIKPYDSQIQFIQAIKSAFNQRGALNKPTMIFYRTMIGSGKTSASLALSQLIHECKLLDSKNNNLQVLYTCLIGSVRVQVGRYCYNKGQNFALAAMEKSIKDQHYYYPRIINSWRCRNQKIVDLVITDPYCTYKMFDTHKLNAEEEDIMEHEAKNRKKLVNKGILERENVILFVDQPTAFCKNTSSRATRQLFDILANYPPRLIVFASATMPSAKELTKTIELVRRKNPDLEVIQVNSKQFQIGCQYCSFKGQVIFPHTGVTNKKQLEDIIEIIKTNSFLLKLYTGPSLFFLLKKCEEIGLKGLPKIDELPEVRQEDITRATFKILEILLTQKDDVITQACALAKDQTIMDFKEDIKKDSDDEMFDFLDDNKEDKEEIEQVKQDFVNFKRMLKSDAYKFLGGCLIGTSDPIKFAHDMFQKWVRKIKPIKRLKQRYDKQVQSLNKQIRLLQEDTEMRQQKKTQKISKLQSDKEPKLDFPEHKKINTSEHYLKYCKDKEASHVSMLIKPVPIENSGVLELLDEVDDFILKLLFCGVAVYAQKGLSAKYLDKVEELASANFLAFIITDQSLCYGTNFPISNVILRDDLVKNLNMNEMFQLIGRAGRVGQSWTARAFLQKQGLDKLKQYIHKPENQINDQGRIFEEIADEHLNSPLLKLKNTHSEVRYLDYVFKSQFIEIEVKKKDQDAHVIKKLAIIPFITTKDGIKYLCSNQYSTFKYYQFPTTNLSYADLPKIKNSSDENILNVAFFYANFKDFLYEIADNSIKRLLSNELQGKLVNYKLLNHFKPKVYEPFYNAQTNTLTILIKCEENENFTVKNYKFTSIIGNPFVDNDEVFTDQINKIVDNASQIVDIFNDNPLNTQVPVVDRYIQDHFELEKRQKAAFYKEMVEKAEKEAESAYIRVSDRVADKSMLKSAKEIVKFIAISNCFDVRNYHNKLFHIYPQARQIWKVIESKVDELTK